MVSKVKFEGRSYPVIDELPLGRKKYLIVDNLGGKRKRYLAFDQQAGPRGDLRVIQKVPKSKRTNQLVKIISERLGRGFDNLPGIIEYHSRHQYIYLVLPWVRGQTLKDYLEKASKKNNFPWPSPLESLRLIRGLAHGVSHLHRRNIVHGDLQPQNLILTHDPSRLVMIDYGSAWTVERAVGRELGDGGAPVYTAPELQQFYSLPEQQQCEPINTIPDFRCDQFSISIIFYEMITQKIPYNEYGGAASCEEEYKCPSQFRPNQSRLPECFWKSIDDIINRGLKLDSEQRYPNNKDWLNAIDSLFYQLKNNSLPKFGILDNFIISVMNKFIKK